MRKQEAKERIEKLKKAINKYRYSRLVLNKELISPEAEDTLKKELFDLETQFPDLITPDSPTQRVGGKPLQKFKKIKRAPEQKMNSLNDAFTEQDVLDWISRLKKLNVKISDFYCDLKMDGLAVELIYKNGAFAQGSTRGDGLVGEDITQNLRSIEDIPLSLDLGDLPRELKNEIRIRGEVFINKKEFARVNREQKKKGEKVFANPRNMAAGSLRQLNPEITRSRKLNFFAYNLWGNTELYFKNFPTHEKEYKRLKIFGILPNPLGIVAASAEDIFKFHEKIKKEREGLNYEIDGIVVSINNNKDYYNAKIVGKAPRGAIAYKFAPKESETVVLNIIIQIGRTGILTPVAILKPVQIGGVVVRRATLHNEDEIKRLEVKIGDTVIVGRAGDVIPDIKRVLKELRIGKEKEFRFPKEFCGQKVMRISGEAAHKIAHPLKCELVNRRRLYHFVSRAAFDIEGVGPKIIDALLDNNLISDAADLFNLTEGDLTPLERFGEKSAENIIAALQKSKTIDLYKFIYALGISHAGEETSIDIGKKLVENKNINNPADIIKITEKINFEEWQNIANIGPEVAKSIFDYFSKKENKEFLRKLDKAGVKIISPRVTKATQKLRGKVFVLTGGLKTLTRDEAKDRIRSLGGDINSSVSRVVDYVVAGSEPGEKYEKAKRLKLKVITEKDFLAMLK